MNELMTKVAEVTGYKDLPEPRESGAWLVWEQRGSKGIMDRKVADLKSAGIPAFFNATQRTWGVKAN